MMSDTNRKMHLGLFLDPAGYHVAGWRWPGAPGGVPAFSDYRDMVKTAESAKFDFAFLADAIAVREQNMEIVSRTAGTNGVTLEPIALLAALATSSDRIGLIATASTTYYEPYHIARKFATIDHLSNGRAGWNLVTTANDAEAFNFNMSQNPNHSDRYDRAEEFAAVVRGLWDSFEDDAFLDDKEAGLHSDPKKTHVIDHRGPHFTVRGPLNVARPPQGHPVIVQAGSSEEGRNLAAKTAEVVFTAQNKISGGQQFCLDMQRRLEVNGRDPGSVKVMPGLFPIVGESDQHAEEIYEQLQSLIPPEVGLARLSGQVGGFDFSLYPLDGPVPEMPQTEGPRSRQKLLMDAAREEGLTIRQLYMRNAGSRGHLMMRGTAQGISDQMEAWFKEKAADGFIVLPPYLHGGLNDFTEKVVPELQRRGLFRSEYEGRTLREHLRLGRP